MGVCWKVWICFQENSIRYVLWRPSLWSLLRFCLFLSPLNRKQEIASGVIAIPLLVAFLFRLVVAPFNVSKHKMYKVLKNAILTGTSPPFSCALARNVRRGVAFRFFALSFFQVRYLVCSLSFDNSFAPVIVLFVGRHHVHPIPPPWNDHKRLTANESSQLPSQATG